MPCNPCERGARTSADRVDNRVCPACQRRGLAVYCCTAANAVRIWHSRDQAAALLVSAETIQPCTLNHEENLLPETGYPRAVARRRQCKRRGYLHGGRIFADRTA